MSVRDRISELVVRYGEAIGQPLVLDEAGGAAFRFGELEDLGHFQFLDKSGFLVLWTTIGLLPPDRDEPARAVRILQLQDQHLDGLVFGAEKGTGRLVASSRRSVGELEDVAQIAGWVETFAESVRSVRESLAEDFPVEFDDFDPEEIGEEA